MTTYSPLRTFLKEHMVSDSDWNLTGMGRDVGKYKVEDEEYDRFLELVHSHIFGPRPSACSLLEKHREVGPLLVELDFKYAAGGPLIRRYNMDHMKEFLIQYISALIYFSEVERMTEPLRFYVMMKPSPESDTTNHKDGIHIQCPDMITLPKFQYAIRGFMMERNIVGNVFGSTGLINTAEECYDVFVIHRNNWFLYGAGKPNKKPYIMQQVLCINPVKVHEAMDKDTSFDFENIVKIVGGLIEKDPDHILQCTDPSEKNRTLLEQLSIRKIISLNTPAIRSTRKEEWDDLLEKWGSGKSAPINTVSKTGQVAFESLTVINSSDEELLTIEQIEKWIRNNANDTHSSVALLVYKLYKKEFKCYHTGSRIQWDVYEDNEWKHMPTLVKLRSRLSSKVREYYLYALQQCSLRLMNYSCEEMYKDREIHKTLAKIVRNLEMAGFKDKVMKECQEKFMSCG